MTKRTKEILNRPDTAYGTDYKCYLNHETPWQLLIAAILSAQCTDAGVNIVTGEISTMNQVFCAICAGREIKRYERLCSH